MRIGVTRGIGVCHTRGSSELTGRNYQNSVVHMDTSVFTVKSAKECPSAADIDYFCKVLLKLSLGFS